jgi:hypothetical protein
MPRFPIPLNGTLLVEQVNGHYFIYFDDRSCLKMRGVIAVHEIAMLRHINVVHTNAETQTNDLEFILSFTDCAAVQHLQSVL